MTRRIGNAYVYESMVVMLLLLSLVLPGCCAMTSPLPFRHLPSFYGKVIDADTKEPIPGAVVLAVYYKEVITPVGTNDYIIDGQEVLTDQNGEFEIPSAQRWFVAERGFTRGCLTILKPGYGAFPNHRQSKIIGGSRTWPPSGKHIVYELPKLKTKEERKENVGFMNTYDEIPYQKRELYMKAINEECITVGLSPFPIPNQEGLK